MPRFYTGPLSVSQILAGGYQGPGDLAPPAAVWFGLRGYTAAYVGPCIDISDGAGANTQTINIVNNFLDLVSVNAWVALHGSTIKVTKWYDQTSRGAQQASGVSTAANLTLNGIGSYPCLTNANGTYTWVAGAALTSGQPFTMSFLAKRTTFASATSEIISFGGPIDLSFNSTSGAVRLNAFHVITASAAENQWHSVTGVANSTNSTIAADGNAPTVGDAGTNSMSGGTFNIFGGSDFTGTCLETGLWFGDITSSFATLLNNQVGIYGSFPQ